MEDETTRPPTRACGHELRAEIYSASSEIGDWGMKILTTSEPCSWIGAESRDVEHLDRDGQMGDKSLAARVICSTSSEMGK